MRATLELRGTLAGEHGVGLAEDEVPAVGAGAAADPPPARSSSASSIRMICSNPGKIFPGHDRAHAVRSRSAAQASWRRASRARADHRRLRAGGGAGADRHRAGPARPAAVHRAAPRSVDARRADLLPRRQAGRRAMPTLPPARCARRPRSWASRPPPSRCSGCSTTCRRRSRFVITPVVARVRGPLQMAPNPAEVASVFAAELAALADPARYVDQRNAHVSRRHLRDARVSLGAAPHLGRDRAHGVPVDGAAAVRVADDTPMTRKKRKKRVRVTARAPERHFLGSDEARFRLAARLSSGLGVLAGALRAGAQLRAADVESGARRPRQRRAAPGRRRARHRQHHVRPPRQVAAPNKENPRASPLGGSQN